MTYARLCTDENKNDSFKDLTIDYGIGWRNAGWLHIRR